MLLIEVLLAKLWRNHQDQVVFLRQDFGYACYYPAHGINVTDIPPALVF